MNQLEILQSAYKIMEDITPLRVDCGRLCNQSCCQDNDDSDEEAGMVLFPGEEELFLDCKDWMTLLPISYTSQNQILAVCNGTCPRKRRPLACRIFPLTPYLTKNEVLQIKMDPRAVSLCPLAREQSLRKLQPAFIKAVREASILLLSDHFIKEYIRDLSRELDKYTNILWYHPMAGR